jgi:phage-related minor tail protein
LGVGDLHKFNEKVERSRKQERTGLGSALKNASGSASNCASWMRLAASNSIPRTTTRASGGSRELVGGGERYIRTLHRSLALDDWKSRLP